MAFLDAIQNVFGTPNDVFDLADKQLSALSAYHKQHPSDGTKTTISIVAMYIYMHVCKNIKQTD